MHDLNRELKNRAGSFRISNILQHKNKESGKRVPCMIFTSIYLPKKILPLYLQEVFSTQLNNIMIKGMVQANAPIVVLSYLCFITASDFLKLSEISFIYSFLCL